MKSTISIGLLLLFLHTTTSSSAAPGKRRGRFVPGWTLTVNAGTSLFYGEIKQNNALPILKFKNEVRASGSLILSRRILPYFQIRYQVLLGQLAGTERIPKITDSYFKSNIFENNLNFKVYIPEFFHPRNRYTFTYYVYAGCGLVRYRSIRYALWQNQFKENKIVATTGYDMDGNKTKAELAMVIPVGFGIDYTVSNKVSLNFDYSRRFTNTDKIDAAMQGARNDQYDYTSIGITYYFSGMFGSVGGGQGHGNSKYLKKHKNYVPHYKY